MSRKKSKGIPTRWLNKAEDKERLESTIRNSRITLTRLAEMVREDIESFEHIREEDYDSPSWISKQAHLNGKREYAKMILSLLSFID